ncbi:MAG: DUF1800 domain-containing protein [Thermoanaerobaculia bacterium]
MFPKRRRLLLLLTFGLSTGALAAQSPVTAVSAGAPASIGPRSSSLEDADAVRLLEQATWGPTEALVRHVEEIGIPAFLDEQIAAPVSGFPDLPPYPGSSKVGCPDGSESSCFRDHYTMYPLQVAFFQNGMTGADQLRQRVAWALHEILVVSGLKVKQPSAMSPYLNVLADDALGNFRQLLSDVTLNPAMGDYLDMVDNDKADPSGSVQPNENYGREVMQLFSIGVHELAPDGTPLLDSRGNPIPAYDQDTIEGFSHVFTGWTYAPHPGAPMRPHNPRNFASPMVLYRDPSGQDANHDKGAKELLSYEGARNATLPAGQDGEVDLNEALDNIFRHPNVGPFIGKQLIQHLVTSNPGRAYVERIAQVFDDDGRGVRGNLAAVVRAILLDPEARGSAKTDPDNGRLREPVQFILGLLRAFGAQSDGVLGFAAKQMGEDVFDSPSVFSYYPHDYAIPGTEVEGPEFGIETTSTAVTRLNFVTTLAFGRIQPAAPAAGTALDLSMLTTLAGSPDALVERLNRLLLHGTISEAMREIVVGAVSTIDPAQTALRAGTALQLVAGSSQYQIER